MNVALLVVSYHSAEKTKANQEKEFGIVIFVFSNSPLSRVFILLQYHQNDGDFWGEGETQI